LVVHIELTNTEEPKSAHHVEEIFLFKIVNSKNIVISNKI
jgi:hypothetical protein